MLESLLAYHCGPALAGIKPANIVACHKSRIPDFHHEISKIRTQLAAKDIHIEVLCECEKRALVMVYRKKVLEKQLSDSAVREFLSRFEYSADLDMPECIEHLKRRVNQQEFPHEIGVFLGYPLHDIDGFINHRDNGCLLVGEWKVYKDAENAKKLFSRYKACREAILRRIVSGYTLAQIFCAA